MYNCKILQMYKNYQHLTTIGNKLAQGWPTEMPNLATGVILSGP